MKTENKFNEKITMSHFTVDNIDAEFYFGSMFQNDFRLSPFSTKAHQHAWYEFHCVEKGSLKIESNEKTYVINANEALFIPACIYHNTKAETDDIIYTCFGFELEKNGKSTIENLYEEMTGIFSVSECVKFTECKKLSELAQELISLVKGGKSPDSCRMHNSLVTFLFLLSDSLCSEANTTNNHGNDITQAVTDKRNYLLDILTTNQIENITLEELSKKIYLDKKQINKIVKKRYNMTYKQKQIRFRIENAKKLLNECSRPIDSIARQIGYTNLTSFYKAFYKIVGMTPAEYRKNKKTEKDA